MRETAGEAALGRPAKNLDLFSDRVWYDVIRNKTFGLQGNQIFNRTALMKYVDFSNLICRWSAFFLCDNSLTSAEKKQQTQIGI